MCERSPRFEGDSSSLSSGSSHCEDVGVGSFSMFLWGRTENDSCGFASTLSITLNLIAWFHYLKKKNNWK